jgi:glycosyltransferase involved in cell wall biosynthesis
MAPKLSIVIPAYNMERWLPVALESCLWQTESDIEVIVVNDGSADRTLDVAGIYAEADSRVKVFDQENRGAGVTREVGQQHARGDYLLWLDADDFLDRDAAQKMLAVAYRDDVDMVCGNAVVFSEKTFNTRRYFYLPEASGITFDDPAYWKSKVLWRWIFRTSFLRRIGLTHPAFKLGQDVCSMYQALTSVNRFSQCGHFMYYFRQDHKRTSMALPLEVEHQIAHFIEVKRILLDAGAVKPLVKYLNENLFRDIKKLAPRMTGEDAVWRERCVSHCLTLFESLDPAWFRSDFLAPQLKEQTAFLPLVDAFISKDMQEIEAQLDIWKAKGLKRKAADKENSFHTLRRRIKALCTLRSLKTRFLLRSLERRARRRLSEQGIPW